MEWMACLLTPYSVDNLGMGVVPSASLRMSRSRRCFLEESTSKSTSGFGVASGVGHTLSGRAKKGKGRIRLDPADGTSWETGLPEPSPSIGFPPLQKGTPSCGFEPQTTRLTAGGSTRLSYDGP